MTDWIMPAHQYHAKTDDIMTVFERADEMKAEALNELAEQAGMCDDAELTHDIGETNFLGLHLADALTGLYESAQIPASEGDDDCEGCNIYAYVICRADGSDLHLSDVCLADFWQGESQSEYPYRAAIAV